MRSFWPPYLQSLNDCIFCFFLSYQLKLQGFGELIVYHLKGLGNTFPTMYCMPWKLWNCGRKTNKKKTNTHLLGDYKSRWSNDRNRSNDSGSFSHRFLLVFGLHIDLLIYASVVKKMVLSTPRCLRILSNLQTYYRNVPLYRREHFLKPLPSSTESISWKKNVSETEICQSKQV